MSLLSEFREFAVKGNVIDLAVGVIIGAAFGKIVDSLVKDVIMPIIARVTGGIDFSNHFLLLGPMPANYTGPMTYEALTKAGVPILAWGNFLTIVLNFIILAFVIFLMVKEVNKLRRRHEEKKEEAPPPEDIQLLREIRDSLKGRLPNAAGAGTGSSNPWKPPT